MPSFCVCILIVFLLLYKFSMGCLFFSAFFFHFFFFNQIFFKFQTVCCRFHYACSSVVFIHISIPCLNKTIELFHYFLLFFFSTQYIPKPIIVSLLTIPKIITPVEQYYQNQFIYISTICIKHK